MNTPNTITYSDEHRVEVVRAFGRVLDEPGVRERVAEAYRRMARADAEVSRRPEANTNTTSTGEPTMTPAEELTAAAEKLHARATTRSEGPHYLSAVAYDHDERVLMLAVKSPVHHGDEVRMDDSWSAMVLSEAAWAALGGDECPLMKRLLELF